MSNSYFSEADLQLIESLQFDSAAKPNYEAIKSCLTWPDECPEGLTPQGYEKLCDLWIARSFIHQNKPFSSWKLAPTYFEDVWKTATAQGFKWPGFQRLVLSGEDAEYYRRMMAAAAKAI